MLENAKPNTERVKGLFSFATKEALWPIPRWRVSITIIAMKLNLSGFVALLVGSFFIIVKLTDR